MNSMLITKGAAQHEDFTAPELLDVTFEIKEVAEDGTFAGYGSTFGNVDLGRDIMAKGSFTKTLKRKSLRDIKMLWQHNSHEPIGVWRAMHEDDKGLYVEGQLLINQSVPLADKAYALMKAGAIGAMSIGFSIPPDGYDIDEKKRARIIKEADLWEVSIVTFPMNPRAKIRRVKSVVPFQDLDIADRGRAWDSDAAKARVRQWAGGGSSLEDMDWGKYREAFLWYDDNNAENITSYKLPIADIIGGKLTVVPRAVFAAAGAMLGARGGVDIPDNARPRVISHLERYYSKMDMESPFKMVDMEESAKNFNIALLCAALDAKEYEQALREVGFSNSEAKAITAKIGPQREVEASGIRAALKAANEALINL